MTASNSSNQISPGVLFKPRRYTYFFNNQISSSSRHLKVSNMTKYSNRAGLNEDFLNQHKQNLVCNLMKYFVKAKTKVSFLNQWHFWCVPLVLSVWGLKPILHCELALILEDDPLTAQEFQSRGNCVEPAEGLVLDNIYMKGRAALLMFFPPSLSLCVMQARWEQTAPN